MIRHCVAHPFGAAVGRSSQQAALLEPGKGSHPPSMGIRFAVSPDAKNRPWGRFFNLAVGRDWLAPSLALALRAAFGCPSGLSCPFVEPGSEPSRPSPDKV